MSICSVSMMVVLAAMVLSAGCIGTTGDVVQPPLPEPDKPNGAWYAETSSEIINGTEIHDGYRVNIRGNDTAVVTRTHDETYDNRQLSLTEWVNGTVTGDGTNLTIATSEYGNFTLKFSLEGKSWKPELLITPQGTEHKLENVYTMYVTSSLV